MADRSALWDQGQDESVEVNQRALIDKVLARYSGEFTVFRELLQNADDAGATAVQILFETVRYLEQNKATAPEGPATMSRDSSASDAGYNGTTNIAEKPLPDLKEIIVGQWAFKNNGTVFREEDWNRLKKIAEGNPDEQKIGAFGVGFYSLFSVTEEPFVTSGTQWMGFYWKDGKDQLFARRGNLPPAPTPDPWTTFTLPLRENGPLPGTPLDLLRFLSSSITFMNTLSNVELFLDGTRLGRISKDIGSPQPIGVPPSLAAGQQIVQMRNDNFGSLAGAMIGGWGDWGMRTPTPSRKEKDKESKWNWLTPRKYMNLYNVTSTPVHIRAEVIKWVYMAGSEKAKPLKKRPAPASSSNSTQSGGNSFLASFISSFTSPRNTSQPRQSPSTSGRRTPQSTSRVSALLSDEKVDVAKLAEDQKKVVESSVLLSVFTAEARVKLDDKMETELERATKKKAPSNIKIGLIYTGKDEYDASEKEDLEGVDGTKDSGSVFLGLRADLEGNNSSRVYIGHATGQTTGISGHISARFIPTVERESIDLVDKNVSVWNKELLHLGGYLSRVAYETELANISRLYTAALQTASSPMSGPDANLTSWLQARCLHALKFFTFRPSTPSADVSLVMQSAFFAASDVFNIFSTSGVKPASDVRIRSPEMEKFVKALPVLPKEIQDGATDIISVLQGKNMIRQITFDDIISEMRGRCFEEDEMLECIKWRVGLPRQPAFDAHFREQFVGAGVFRVASREGSTDGERIVPLVAISTYISPSGLVPTEGPYPSTTLPLKFSTIRGVSLTTYNDLFGWTAFSINDWVAYLSASSPAEAPSIENGITTSPLFAEKALIAVAKGWNNISRSNQEDIVRRLSPLPCIPTQLGLKLPSESYFSAVHVFSDLPIVSFSTSSGALAGRMKTPMENLLSTLGVRKHVDLQVVFNRMIKTGDWTIPQLVKYLASVRDTLSIDEIERLKQTAAFSREGDAVQDLSKSDTASSSVTNGAPNGATKLAPRRPRFKIGDLFEPTDAMRQLKLPILDWGDNPKWHPNNAEGKFLFSLGLQRHPSLKEILQRAASSDTPTRELALKYFFDKYAAQYTAYQPSSFPDLAFIPAIRPDGTEFLARHVQTFSEPGCAVMGFAVVRSDIKDDALSKLKIARHPPASIAAATLISNPPKTEEQARRIFEYLTNLIGDFSSSDLQRLKLSSIIPAQTPRSTGLVAVKPAECYFKRDDGQSHFHSKLFTFVDFGARANNFLAACGVRSAPTTEEVAKILTNNPTGFYSLAGGAERFKAELRQIAASFGEITATTKQLMKKSPILLASRVIDERDGSKPGQRRDSSTLEDDEEIVTVAYELLRPDQIIIVDDVNTYAQFRDVLYAAPQEDILESLYASLGSPRLSQLIKEEYKPIGERKDDSDAIKVRKLVLERLPLFLHERNQVRVRIRTEWMQNASNFVVKKVARLILQKTLVWNGQRAVKDSEASAAAKREGINKTLTLYVAHNIPLDLYEVANSLCRQIFDTPRVNDSLLLSTILSTDLPSLKRRGYNVDRILNQQKAEREARESARRAAEREAQQQRERETAQYQLPGAFVEDMSTPKGPSALPPKLPSESTGSDASSTMLASKPEATSDKEKEKHGKGLLNSVKSRISKNDGTGKDPRSGLERFLSGAGRSPTPTPSGSGGAPRWEGGAGGDGNAQPTPESDINKNVQQAIDACKPEARNLLQNRQQMERIKETLNEGYCDSSGMEGDLFFVGVVEGIRVYAGKDTHNAQDLLLRGKVASIARFMMILRPLKKVYKLPDASLHMFWNERGPVIAFNAGGALFVNLRYFEGWHDEQVKTGERMKGMISWYFTLAHEIAHNLVGPHNAEHSYYMNQISSTHLLNLIDELQVAQFGEGR